MDKVLKLGIDIDGVLADFTKAYSYVINTLRPETIPVGYEPDDWDWTVMLKGKTVEVADAVHTIENAAWDRIRSTPNFWLKLRPYEENLDALELFLRMNHDVEVYYCTSRIPTKGSPLLAQTQNWLGTYGVLTSRTSVIPVVSGSMKGDFYRTIGCQFSIDDRDRNVLEVTMTTGLNGHQAYLLDRPWNRNYFTTRRVTSLDQFLKIALQAREEWK